MTVMVGRNPVGAALVAVTKVVWLPHVSPRVVVLLVSAVAFPVVGSTRNAFLLSCPPEVARYTANTHPPSTVMNSAFIGVPGETGFAAAMVTGDPPSTLK